MQDTCSDNQFIYDMIDVYRSHRLITHFNRVRARNETLFGKSSWLMHVDF